MAGNIEEMAKTCKIYDVTRAFFFSCCYTVPTLLPDRDRERPETSAPFAGRVVLGDEIASHYRFYLAFYLI
ncbi:MAG: hypothetical protein LBQ90_05470 [Synergistaceae bacterium]|nr:hypothetical protein [Synergistaceae bacterium]